MSDINSVVLIGRLTRNAELKYTNTGMAVSKISIAINRKSKKDDQWVDEVSFFDITIWGKIAESLQAYLIKGKQIGVEGELRQNRWEQDGKTHSKIEINANKIQLLGGGKPVNETENIKNNLSENTPVETDKFQDDIPF